ncbi:MAG: type 4a pilus biogenesis protein PilO [Deltaproteobacteria bacterium]|nr:type 4a pilus biogenesis protein PilO [Deltaproteobacteria bacterium]
MKTEAFFQKVGEIKMPVRILIFVGTIVVLGGVYLWFVYLPKTSEIAETKHRIAQLENKLRRAKVRAKALKKFEAEHARVDAQFKEALRLLPNKKEIPSLLRTITQLGTESQLEFRLFRPRRERARDFYIEIPVSIQVSGNYHNVAVFFDKVGRMERIVNILNVSMKPVAPRSTKLITNCDAVTYSFKGETNGEKAQKK